MKTCFTLGSLMFLRPCTNLFSARHLTQRSPGLASAKQNESSPPTNHETIMRVLFVEDSEITSSLPLIICAITVSIQFTNASRRPKTWPRPQTQSLGRRVSDYSMPEIQWGECGAEEVFQESRLDIPFICLSGSLAKNAPWK